MALGNVMLYGKSESLFVNLCVVEHLNVQLKGLSCFRFFWGIAWECDWMPILGKKAIRYRILTRAFRKEESGSCNFSSIVKRAQDHCVGL